MPEKKTRPQDKWDAKAGMISKTYKVKREVAERFQEVCKEAGVSMGVQLSELMATFIEQNQKG